MTRILGAILVWFRCRYRNLTDPEFSFWKNLGFELWWFRVWLKGIVFEERLGDIRRFEVRCLENPPQIGRWYGVEFVVTDE